MAILPIAGPSYVYSSRSFDAQRSVNVYPVVSETGTSKTPQTALQGTPGLLQFCDIDNNECRNSLVVKDRVFFVVGNGFYEIFSDGTSTQHGTLSTTTGYVGIETNPTQLCVVDGPNGYIFTYATNVFEQITDPYFLGAGTVNFLDGYFMFPKPDSNQYYISALNDGLTGDPLDIASAEASSSNIVAIKTVHQQAWIFKGDSIQMVYDSGAQDFPFSVVQGTTIQYGCAAKGSVVTIANTVFWLGKDKDGHGTVWMAEGYQPQRISTFPVETAIQGYDSIDNAIGYSYQEDGHFFYVLTFTSANTTWVYDVTMKQWHERCYLNPSSGVFERHRGNTHCFAFDKHLIGDYETGQIYEQSLSIYDDNGNPKKWLRSLPHLTSPNKNYIYYDRIELDMQVGVGLISGADENTNPSIILRWSNDGAYTWSSEFWRSAGKIGEYLKRVIWNRCGRARDRVFEFSGTSNTKVFITAAYIDSVEGTN